LASGARENVGDFDSTATGGVQGQPDSDGDEFFDVVEPPDEHDDGLDGGQAPAAGAVEVENTDRITCLRQDDLDLVIPHTEEQVVRMVLGLGGTTDRDVYIQASDVWIKNLSARATLRRHAQHMFEFEIDGDEMFDEQGEHYGEKVAGVNFWITGVDVLTKSTMINWGASLFTDRSLLNQGQEGTLKFKIYGQGKAVYNTTTMEWELKITRQEAKPFKFNVQNQWILQKVLNDYGGIDQLIMDAMWPAITDALPKHLIASFRYLSPDELWPKVKVEIKGGSSGPAAPLDLDLGITANFDTYPPKLMEVFAEHFDAGKIAHRQTLKLLESMDLEDLWEYNKPTVKVMLGRYGLQPEFIDQPFNRTALEIVLAEVAAEKAGAFNQALKPFIKAGQKGSGKEMLNVFEGLTSSIRLQGGWKHSNNGLIYLEAGTNKVPEGQPHPPLLTLPKALLEMTGATGQLVAPPAGSETSIGYKNLVFEAPKLTLDSVSLKDVRVRAGGENGTVAKTWKLGGTVRDVAVKLPKAWDPGYKAALDQWQISYVPDGDISIYTGPRNLQVSQIPEPPSDEPMRKLLWKDGARTGDYHQIDGKLPQHLKRGISSQDELSKDVLLPDVDLSAHLQMKGRGNKLQVSFQADASTSIGLRPTLRSVLAPRPAEDFGYVFYSSEFDREVEDGEDVLPKESKVTAVVSCGYLRLYNKTLLSSTKATDNPLKKLEMTAQAGQLQLDLSSYTEAPKTEVGLVKPGLSLGPQVKPGGFTPENSGLQRRMCVILYSSGYRPRTVSGWFSSKEAKERLCGPDWAVKDLVAAIELQVKRFRSNYAKSKKWNFGTHEANETQYPLPEGFQQNRLGPAIGIYV
jgi:hypothetical protein